MPILWFKSAKHHFLSSRVMAMGMLLACFAWLMQLSPLLAPLWLDKVTLGHGLCVKLEPLLVSRQLSHQLNHELSHQSSQDLSQQPHAHHHTTSTHHAQQDLTHKTRQADPLNDPLNDLDSDHAVSHDCDICLALLAFEMPKFDFELVVRLLLAYTILLQALYRALSRRFVAFLRPPSRASPAFHPDLCY